jgi:hypothetical protein
MYFYFVLPLSACSTFMSYYRHVLLFAFVFFWLPCIALPLYNYCGLVFLYYCYHYSTSRFFILLCTIMSCSAVFAYIYINSEPFSALIGVFLILLCLAKLLNQYYYSFPGTRFLILLARHVYLLLLLLLPFSAASSKLCLHLRVCY